MHSPKLPDRQPLLNFSKHSSAFGLLLRFSPEEKAKRHPCAYLPFGLGPRNCVGMRFALMEAKMALVEIVRRFHINLSPDTKVV